MPGRGSVCAPVGWVSALWTACCRSVHPSPAEQLRPLDLARAFAAAIGWHWLGANPHVRYATRTKPAAADGGGSLSCPAAVAGAVVGANGDAGTELTEAACRSVPSSCDSRSCMALMPSSCDIRSCMALRMCVWHADEDDCEWSAPRSLADGCVNSTWRSSCVSTLHRGLLRDASMTM